MVIDDDSYIYRKRQFLRDVIIETAPHLSDMGEVKTVLDSAETIFDEIEDRFERWHNELIERLGVDTSDE